jgi:hypothetical protein
LPGILQPTADMTRVNPSGAFWRDNVSLTANPLKKIEFKSNLLEFKNNEK